MLKNKEIAILGGNGLLGSTIVNMTGGVAITRTNYDNYVGKKFETIINCAGNKYTYIADQNPIKDLESSLIYSYKTVCDFQFDKYIYLSSVAAYDESAYGMHRRFSEDMLRFKIPEKYLILRSCNIISKNIPGIVSDIYHEKEVGVSEDTFMHFLDIKEFTSILKLIHNINIKKDTINIGSKLAISPNQIGELFKKEVKYKEKLTYKNYNMNTENLSKIFKLKNSSFYIKREFSKNEEL